MNIKNKLIISYIIIIFIISSFWISYSYIEYRSILNKTIELTNNSLNIYSKENYKHSKSYIEPFSQKYVELRTQILAEKITPLIKEDLSENKKISEDRRIWNEVKKLIYIKDKIVVGYSYLFAPDDQIIISPNDYSIKVTSKDWKSKFPELFKLLQEAREKKQSKGYYEFFDVNNRGLISVIGEKYGVLVQIPGTNYCIGTTIFLNNYKTFSLNLMENVKNKILESIKDKFSEQAQAVLVSVLSKSLTIIISVIIVFIIIGFFIAKTISDPIQRLTNKIKGINSTNLQFKSENSEFGTGETKELSNAFAFLIHKLKSYMKTLKTEMAEKDIINKELDTAKEIQDYTLPKVTDEFIRPEFCIYGKLRSAKKVAGDFYDFFWLTKNKVAIILGDVSGKGISAAYFMSKVKILIKAFCLEEKNDPSKVLAKVNNIIAADNKACMFATVFLGYYEVNNGRLAYSNAGHHAAIKINNDNSITEFGEQGRPVLGFIADSEYLMEIETLDAGEDLVLYTDGICEATSANGELYGKVRLLRGCLKYKSSDIKDMLNRLVDDVVEFETSTPQSDDITILGLGRVK